MKSIFILLMSFVLVSFNCRAEMSLSDLGFKNEDLKIDPQITKTMEVRTQKLQLHQKLGLATMAMMTGTFLVSDTAVDKNIHKFMGIATGLMYWTTAYFSLSAPEVENQKESGSSKLHKTLAWIHAPLMTIVPILGYINKRDHEKGREPTGIAKAHGALATTAYASFMAAGLSMYFDFSF